MVTASLYPDPTKQTDSAVAPRYRVILEDNEGHRYEYAHWPTFLFATSDHKKADKEFRALTKPRWAGQWPEPVGKVVLLEWHGGLECHWEKIAERNPRPYEFDQIQPPNDAPQAAAKNGEAKP